MDLSNGRTEVVSAEEEVKAQENGNALSKFSSLIHILKGHEEFTLSANGIIISSNLEAVNITGYEEYEVIGKSISLFYSEDEKDKAISDLDKAARFKYCVVSGIRRKKRDTPFWAKMKISALYDKQNRVSGYKVIMKDATHRALSNARVQTLRDEYLAIFNNPFVGSFKFRMSDYRIQMCNQKTLEIVGRTNSSDIYFDSLFKAKAQFDHFTASLLKDKRIDGFKFLVNDNRIEENWAVVSAKYFEGKGFAEGVLFDISEQHSQMMELHRVNTQLDNFIYHASHDLRAPITTIMGLINLAKLEPEKTRNYIDMMEARITHLDVLLKDLVSVSYNNNADVGCAEFNFTQEVDSILKEHVNLDKLTVVNVEIDHDHPYYTDQVRLRTILRNLISNSFKYKRPDSGRHMVRIKIKVEPNQASLEFQDNGVGIAWSLKDRVWDMFFRASDQSAGTGLGLYIVRCMVEKLKGEISFESTPSVGTTFLVVLPNQIIN